MKVVNLFLAIVFVAVTASAAFSECSYPKDGVYTTSKGRILGGRASEAWCGGTGPGRPGNTESAMSWDGTSLGSQWRVWGMSIDQSGAVETARHFDAAGNGWIDYSTTYTGGQFWLSGNCAWGDGSGDFTGAITYYNVGARVSYVGWQAVGVTSNVFMTGTFDGCQNCSIDYAISNALLVWRTGYDTAMPSDYPPFQCSATSGELFDACCIVAKINCIPIAIETSSWGKIKALYPR